MISDVVVGVIAVFQAVLIVGILWLVFATDRRARKRVRAEEEGVEVIREPLREFLVGGDHGEAIAAALRELPRGIASRLMERMGTSILAPERLRDLAVLVRHDQWVKDTLADAKSGIWWKRMHAARLLPMVYASGDQELLGRLLLDKHPAVAAAATPGIALYAEPPLIRDLIRNLHHRSPTVRLQQMQGLKQHPEAVTPILVNELTRPDRVTRLRILIQFAEIVGTSQAVAAVIPFANHPDPVVRAFVARALRAAFVPGAIEAARKLLHDEDWRVRAAAARALEGLRDVEAVPELREALRDEEWWVRFRAAVALAGLGDAGREALGNAIGGDDAYASEMAITVSGLSEANRLDLSG